MSRDEAAEFRDRYVAAMPTVLERFRAEVPVRLDGSRDSLVPLWAWCVTQVDEDPKDEPGEQVPLWYDPDDEFAGKDVSGRMLRLADGLAYYFAECVLRAVPAAGWSVAHSTTRNFVHENKPVLSGFRTELNPVHLVLMALLGARTLDTKRRPEALRDLFDVWVSEAAA